MKSRYLAMLAVLALALGAGFVAGCGDDDDDGGGDSTTNTADLGLIQDGQLLVGVDTPYEPFEIGQPPDITGYDIEVMNAIADKLGLEVTYQDTSFDTIFRDVGQGQFDTAAAASSITPEREKTVDFTDPYYSTVAALLVPEGSDIATFEDLGGTIVGSQDGTTLEEFANNETDASEVRGFPEGPDAIAAMRTGQVDAVVIDLPVALDAVEKQGGVEIVDQREANELLGFAVPPDKDALREAMNSALDDIKGDGTLDELYQQYFDESPPESVSKGKHEPT